MSLAALLHDAESAPSLKGVVGPGLRRDDALGEGRQLPNVNVIPLKSGTHASLRLLLRGVGGS